MSQQACLVSVNHAVERRAKCSFNPVCMMLPAVRVRSCNSLPVSSARTSCVKPFSAAQPLQSSKRTSRRAQQLPQAFFDKFFRPGKSHSPELVRLDVADEGGLAKTSLELFGPLVTPSLYQQSCYRCTTAATCYECCRLFC